MKTFYEVVGSFFTPRTIESNDIQQHQWEITKFLELASIELRPELTVELGTYKGFTTALLSLISDRVITIDKDQYDTSDAGRYWRHVTIHIADATKPESAQGIGPIDLLFIDDGHYYDDIVKEFAIWRPHVRPGGWIAFHDINPLANIGPDGKQPDCIQVTRFWNELKGDKQEIIATEEHRAKGYRGHLPHGGIGILRL